MYARTESSSDRRTSDLDLDDARYYDTWLELCRTIARRLSSFKGI